MDVHCLKISKQFILGQITSMGGIECVDRSIFRVGWEIRSEMCRQICLTEEEFCLPGHHIKLLG